MNWEDRWKMEFDEVATQINPWRGKGNKKRVGAVCDLCQISKMIKEDNNDYVSCSQYNCKKAMEEHKRVKEDKPNVK